MAPHTPSITRLLTGGLAHVDLQPLAHEFPQETELPAARELWVHDGERPFTGRCVCEGEAGTARAAVVRVTDTQDT